MYTLLRIGYLLLIVTTVTPLYAVEPAIALPPIYVQKDEAGNLFRIKLDFDPKNPTYTVKGVYLDKADMVDLEAAGFQVSVLPLESGGEGKNNFKVSGSCPVPTDFVIRADSSGTVTGNLSFLTTNSPSGTTTQWVVFDFYALNYRGQPTHNIIVPFFKKVLHGWGAFFGNNSSSVDGCGPTALFTTQIEGWAQLPPPPPPGILRNDWQSKTFNGPNSCGAKMVNGFLGSPYDPQPRYRMTIHASTGKWVAYKVDEYQPSGGLVPLTPWKGLQVTSQPWPKGSPPLDDTAQGLFFGSTEGGSN